MKKFKLFCFVVTALLAFAGCSNDDEGSLSPNIEEKSSPDETVFMNAPENLDASLLPGYWIKVQNGERLRSGIWFSDEEDTAFGYGGKKTALFTLKDSTYVPADAWRHSPWMVRENGVIYINTRFGEVVTRLTKDTMVIKYMNESCTADHIEYYTQEYVRLHEPIEMEYSYDTYSNYGPFYNNYNCDNARREYVSLESLPEWLISWITSAEGKTNRLGEIFRKGYNDPKLFRGEWNGTAYYYIYLKDNSCVFCDSYYEDGTPLDFENEEVKQAFDSSIAQMKRIIIN
ncbi:MAG: hypothetical protein J5506_04155 [Prevotella sp.]|nr:hypothetical protein [Prevotella sp.]